MGTVRNKGERGAEESRPRHASEALARTVQQNQATIFIAVGYMLALFPFNWGLAAASHQAVFLRPLDFNAIVDIGEVGGFVLAMAAAWMPHRKPERLGMRLAPFVLMAVGNGLIALDAARPSSPTLGACGDLATGCGYALCLVMWLETMSKLPPRKMLIVISVGFLFNFASYPVIAGVGTLTGYAYALTASAISAVLLIVSDPSPAAPPAATEAGRSNVYVPPKRLIVFASIIPFAFGFCTSYLGVGVWSLGLKMGFALPAAIIVAGLAVRYRTFDLTTVYWITCPLMTIGLLSSFFLQIPPTISKALITAALGSVFVVVYIVVRVQSQERNRNPLFAFALLCSLITVFTVAGKETERLISGAPWEMYLIIGLIATVVASYGFIIAGSNGADAFNMSAVLSEETERDYAMRLAQAHRLSERETSVYALMLDERTIAEIAEELFIAPSTVRAHISRIYEKFDAHSRQEFFRKTRG